MQKMDEKIVPGTSFIIRHIFLSFPFIPHSHTNESQGIKLLNYVFYQ